MKVFIAVPAYRGITCEKFFDSLEETVQLFIDSNIDHVVSVLPGCCYIQVARNKLVQQFLESDCDTMLFLDDDISWKPEDAVRLLNVDKPIVAGIYPIKSNIEEYPMILDADESGKTAIIDGLLTASRVPTGFLLIKREVFEKIRAANPHLVYTEVMRGTNDFTPVEYFDYFPQGVYNGVWTGEDYAFCKLWCDLGETIHILADIDFEHHSDNMTYKGNLSKFLVRYTHERQKETV